MMKQKIGFCNIIHYSKRLLVAVTVVLLEVVVEVHFTSLLILSVRLGLNADSIG